MVFVLSIYFHLQPSPPADHLVLKWNSIENKNIDFLSSLAVVFYLHWLNAQDPGF